MTKISEDVLLETKDSAEVKSCKDLFRAILHRAVLDLIAGYREKSWKIHRKCAERWFNGSGEELISFRELCEYIDVDADMIIKVLRERNLLKQEQENEKNNNVIISDYISC